MVYGETGMLPVEYHIKCRMIKFWVSLITGKQTKYSCIIYKMCLSLYMGGLLECHWMDCIKQIINDCGMTFVFNEQLSLDKKWLTKVFLSQIKQTLKDQTLQKWASKLSDPNNEITYFYYKEFCSNYSLKKYLSILPTELWIPLCKFRTRNHRLPVEFYSWNKFQKPHHERICNICNLNDIGDEYHYIMKCPVFNELRDLYISPYFKNRPSVYKFIALMKTEKENTLIKLAKFTRDILNVIQ